MRGDQIDILNINFITIPNVPTYTSIQDPLAMMETSPNLTRIIVQLILEDVTTKVLFGFQFFSTRLLRLVCNLHSCFANKASLNFLMVLKPKPPSNLGMHKLAISSNGFYQTPHYFHTRIYSKYPKFSSKYHQIIKSTTLSKQVWLEQLL